MPWQKGQSGNPGGRPKSAAVVKEAAQAKGERAIERLVELMESENLPVAVRAAQALLDRAYGRPEQSVELSGPGGGPIDVSGLPPEEAYKRLLNGAD